MRDEHHKSLRTLKCYCRLGRNRDGWLVVVCISTNYVATGVALIVIEAVQTAILPIGHCHCMFALSERHRRLVVPASVSAGSASGAMPTRAQMPPRCQRSHLRHLGNVDTLRAANSSL